ncbi:MAG: hypothetical protein AAF479_07035, partial [Pseudomonadota bacterium]
MTSRTDAQYLPVGVPQRVSLFEILAVFVLTLLFLYLLRPIELSDNSLMYIGRVEDSKLFYAPHLLHAAIIWVFNEIFFPVASCDIACAGMIHSMLWAAVAVTSVYLIALCFLATRVGSALTAMAVLFAHGFWVFATQLEVYVPTVGCVAAATAVLFTNPRPTLSRVRIVAAAVLWALATTYHMGSIVLFIPFCAYFFSVQGFRGWQQLAIVSILAGGLVLSAYVVIYNLDHALIAFRFDSEDRTFVGFLTWVFGLAGVPMTDWGQLENWQPAALFRAGWRQIMALTLLPEYITQNQRPLWVIGAVVAVATLVWNAVQLLKRSDSIRGARLYFLLLFIVLFMFFAWWQPMVHKFYIPSSFPLVVLIAMAVRDCYNLFQPGFGRYAVAGAATVAVAVLFVFNLSSVLELRHSLGPDYAEAEVFDKLTPEGCEIYTVGHHLNPLRVYFDRRQVTPMRRYLTSFYADVTGDPRPDVMSVEDEKCALMPLGFLSKKYYEALVAEHLGSELWPRYVGLFFDTKEDP